MMRVNKPGSAGNEGDAVPPQLRAHHLHLALHHKQDTGPEVGDADVFLDDVITAVECPLAKSGEVQNRLAQGLARNRPGVKRDSADHVLSVNDGDALAEFGSGNRAFLSGRAGSDDYQIETSRVVRHCRSFRGVVLRGPLTTGGFDSIRTSE
jgi:hypothetical protein